MDQPDQDIQTKSPNDLLREQVLLLREVSSSLSEIQVLQTRMKENLSGLYAINLKPSQESKQVYIADINMPFMSMVGFMIKWSIAAIPAGIILLIVGGLVWLVLGVVFGGVLAGLGSLLR